MEKRYNPAEMEEKWIKLWAAAGVYAFDKKSDKEVFSVDTPPPYVSADHLHLGHAMSYIQPEIIVRYKRMMGYNVFYPMGFDDNGLPTERFVEKKHRVDKGKITKKDFIKLCIDETKLGADNYRNLWKSLGIGVDWSLEYNTIGELAQKIAQKSFIELYRKGLIYRKESPTFWCTTCKTALAQADLEDYEELAVMYYIDFSILDESVVTIATTRPEMLPACVALYVNPNDPRFGNLIGGRGLIPIFGGEVPVLASAEVDSEKGTGVIMACTWGDAEDVEKWKSDSLDTKILIDQYGKLKSIAGEFEGLNLKKARSVIVAKLRLAGQIRKEEKIVHTKNVHERCDTPVEFITTKQWFIRILDFKRELLEAGNEIDWYPKHMKEIYDNWTNGLKWDWCISRDRYYGVPFPVWYCEACGDVVFPSEVDLPVDPRANESIVLKCSCGAKALKGEEQVMDTWMISSLSPLINAKWGESENLMDKIYLMDLRVQAFEIIRTWLFYTVAKSLFHSDSRPWQAVLISGWGLDSNGKKMSKSKGNIVRIDKVVTTYSADAIRWWSTSSGLGQNLKYSDKDLRSGLKVVNKLWNVARFILPLIENNHNLSIDSVVNFSDKWILEELQALIGQCTRYFEKNDYNKVRIALEKFFWLKYCDNYLELCKDGIWNAEKYSAKELASLNFSLCYSLEVLLHLFAPIMPFVTEEIYHILSGKSENESIHRRDWPKPLKQLESQEILSFGSELMAIINKIRFFKTNIADSYKLRIDSLSFSTQSLMLIEAASELGALARADKVLINEEGPKGQKYEFELGIMVMEK